MQSHAQRHPKDRHTTALRAGTVTGALVANGVQPYFRGSNLTVAKPSFQDTSKRQKLFLGEKGSITIVFSGQSEFWIKERTWNFTFFSRPGTTERFRWVDCSKNCHPLPAPASFPRTPSAGSGASGVCPAGLLPVTGNCRGRKTILLLPFMVSIWQRLPFLQGTS